VYGCSEDSTSTYFHGTAEEEILCFHGFRLICSLAGSLFFKRIWLDLEVCE